MLSSLHALAIARPSELSSVTVVSPGSLRTTPAPEGNAYTKNFSFFFYIKKR